MRLDLYRFPAAVLGFCLFAVASTAGAAEGRQGYYFGIELGLADAKDMDSEVFGTNHPTECDQALFGADGVTRADGVVDLTFSQCANVVPESIIENSFDLDTGFLGGVSVGYVRGQLRIEAEYLYRSHEGDDKRIRAATAGAVLGDKIPEFNPLDLPSEHVSDFNARQFFVNAYYDFPTSGNSRWTPYVGGGLGWARTSLRYQTRFVRKTEAQGYGQAGDDTEDKPVAAAGTLSYLDSEITDTLFGYQLLGGVDYALADNVSVGVKGRWVHFEELEDSDVWDLIRSHEPVQADGTTPFITRQSFDDIEYWALSIGLKYHF